jgi:hypothetical protein
MKGSVRKRKDGRWEGRVELPKAGGKRKQKYVYADTRRECQRLVNELIHDIETGQFTDSGRLTVKGYMTQWFAVYRGKLAKSTQKSHGNYINNHIIPYFNEQRLKDIKPIDVDKFYNHEREKGYAEKTILQVHRIFSRALTDAVFNRLIPYNPCQSVKAPSPAEFNPMVPDVELYYDMLTAATGTEHETTILLAASHPVIKASVTSISKSGVVGKLSVDGKAAKFEVKESRVNGESRAKLIIKRNGKDIEVTYDRANDISEYDKEVINKIIASIDKYPGNSTVDVLKKRFSEGLRKMIGGKPAAKKRGWW